MPRTAQSPKLSRYLLPYLDGGYNEILVRLISQLTATSVSFNLCMHPCPSQCLICPSRGGPGGGLMLAEPCDCHVDKIEDWIVFCLKDMRVIF